MNNCACLAMRENWRHIAYGLYIVRTQSGFRSALRHFRDGTPKNELEPNTYPTRYPCLLALSLGYSGMHWIRVETIHLNDLQQQIQLSEDR